MDEIYKENAKLVYHFLYSMCHDENLAEELTQETFLKAYQSLERYDNSCKISTWLCQIAKHMLYQYYDKHKREIPSSDWIESEECISHADETFNFQNANSTEQNVFNRIELVDVLKAMQKLPDQIREVIYLRVSTELSFAEIGDILGRSENWARVNFFRGKELLLKERQKHE